LILVEQGPLPPHERTWRHPSELAAEERAILRAQTAPASARLLALATGAVGLAVVGVLVMTVTPRRFDAPIAISATTTPPAQQVGVIGPRSSPEAVSELAESDLASPTRSTLVVIRPSIGSVQALATPIGTGRFAFVTRSAAGDNPERPFEVLLPSGRISSGWMINSISDALIVELDRGEPGHPIAHTRPDADDIVMVMQSPPVTIAFGDVDTLDVDEGVAVIDDEGALVGICSRDGVSTRMIDVTDEGVDATTDDP
jgi:hypothetical protein